MITGYRSWNSQRSTQKKSGRLVSQKFGNSAKKRKLVSIFAIVLLAVALAYVKPSIARKAEAYAFPIQSVGAGLGHELQHWGKALDHAFDYLNVYDCLLRYQRSVKESNPWRELTGTELYSDYVVGKSWIGKSLVKTYQAPIYVLLKSGGLHRTSKEGHITPTVGSDILGQHPIVSGDWTKKSLSELTGLDRLRIKEGLSLLSALEAVTGDLKQVSELEFNQRLGWVVYYYDPAFLVIVGQGNFDEKSRRLAKILAKIADHRGVVQSIDLDYGKLAVVKLKEDGGSGNGQS